MALVTAFLCLSLASLLQVQGQYDSLERQASLVFPPRLSALRDSLVDRGMFQELMFHVLSYYAPTDSGDPLCSNHSAIYQEAFLNDQMWAMRMFDASTKLGNGILQGNLQGLGSYDECLGVQEPQGSFRGQLCVVQTSGVLPAVVANHNISQNTVLSALPLDLSLAVCVPSSCSPSAVQTHWKSITADLNASASVSPTDCSTRDDTPPDSRYWAALAVLGVLCLLVLASTCYDYYVQHQPTKEQRVLLSFSAHQSLRQLFSPEGRADSLDVLDGLRFLAISWIVLGHRFELSLQVPNFSLLNIEKYTTAWFMSPILNMMMAVELFFLLSGCLLSFHFLRARARGERFNLTYFYYKRYIRLTPVLGLVMMLEACIMLHVSEGPLWKRLVGLRMHSCLDYWWTNLLYISNYVNPYRTCVLQTWYLSVDSQLYLLSPLLLLPLSRSRRGLLLLAACYLATTGAAFCNALYLHLWAGATVTLDRRTDGNHGSEYVKTHVRAASWLTGLGLGYLLHCHRQQRLSWLCSRRNVAACWLVSVSLCVAAVYSIAPFQQTQHQYSPLWDSLHIALHRNVFSLGAAGIIFLCVSGRGGYVREVLGWRVLRPLATLSYSVYLCHMGLQTVNFARTRLPITFDMFSLLTGFLSDLLLANLVAVLLYVCVEAPFWHVGRWLYNPEKEEKPAAWEKAVPDHINLDEQKSVL